MNTPPRWLVACALATLGSLACKAPPATPRQPPTPAAPSASAAATPEPPVTLEHRWNFDQFADIEIRDTQGEASGRMGEGALVIYGKRCSKPGPCPDPGGPCDGGVLQLLGGEMSWVSFDGQAGRFERDEFTVMLWVRTQSRGLMAEIVSNRGNPSHGNFFNIRMDPRGRFIAEVDEDEAGTGYIAVHSNRPLNDGDWHHVAVRRQAEVLSLFVDGERVESQRSEVVAQISGSHPLSVGASTLPFQNYPGRLEGLIDDLRIYRGYVADREIEGIYKASVVALKECTWRAYRPPR